MKKQFNRGHFIVEVGRRAWRALMRRARGKVSYSRWFESQMVSDATCRKRVREHIAQFAQVPEISVLLSARHASARYFRAVVDSVTKQLYSHWQLCIAVPVDCEPEIKAIAEEYEKADRRIKTVYGQGGGHDVSAIANGALDQARGEFVALLGDTDELSEFALYLVAATINQNPHIDLIYSDEDLIHEDGAHAEPFFKPQWDPELILGQDYFNHFGVYRRSLIAHLRGFRSGFDTACWWDLLLRCIDQTDAARIHRIPYVLYHRRRASTECAGALKAIEEHVARNGERAIVTKHPVIAGSFKTRFVLGDRRPLVSVIIPTRDRRDLLQPCVSSIRERTTYRHFEIIVIDNQSSDAGTLRYLEHLENSGSARVLRYAQSFNWSAINNFAVTQARGEVIALLNNDIEVLESSWLENMTALAVRPRIGAVGAMLLYPDHRVQHAGIVLGLRGIAGHSHWRAMPCAPGYHGRLQLLQNYSAVTGACLVVSKDRYIEARGMDEELAVAYNDVDFCLKLRHLGYRNIWTPDAVLLHKESASRGYEDTTAKRTRLASEAERLRARWQSWIDDDPFYNPNLSAADEFCVSWPPRLKRPCDPRTHAAHPAVERDAP